MKDKKAIVWQIWQLFLFKWFLYLLRLLNVLLDVIKWQLNFGSCNFGLKSHL